MPGFLVVELVLNKLDRARCFTYSRDRTRQAFPNESASTLFFSLLLARRRFDTLSSLNNNSIRNDGTQVNKID